jgi:hypothetical protein
MLYIDYNWDCGPNGIILDEEFNSDALGWKGGDLFKLVNVNGRQILRKVDPLESFLNGNAPNGKISTVVGQSTGTHENISPQPTSMA